LRHHADISTILDLYKFLMFITVVATVLQPNW